MASRFPKRQEFVPRPRRQPTLITRQRELPPPPPPAPIEQPEELGALRRYLALGARGAGGLVGVTPGIGAIGGAGGEALAQLIEARFDPYQIAAEGAVGAIGGKLAKNLISLIGKPVAAAARGALLGGAAPIARSVIAEGELPEMSEVVTGAGIGGATAGGLSALLGRLSPRPVTQVKPTYEIVPTAQAGGSVLTGGKLSQGKIRGGKLAEVTGRRTITGTGQPIGPPVAAPRTAPGGQGLFDFSEGPVPVVGTAADVSPRVQKVIAAEQTAVAKAAAAEQRAAALAEKEAQKLAEQEAALRRIEKAITDQGLEPKLPTVSESVSVAIPGGRQRLSMGYAAPADDADDVTTAVAKARAPRSPQGPPVGPDVTPKAPAGMAPEAAPDMPGVPSAPPITPTSPPPTAEPIDLIERIRRLGTIPPRPMPGEPPRVQAIGSAYDIAKGLKAGPEAGPGTERLRSQLGRLLHQESQVAKGGMPPVPSPGAPPLSPIPPVPPPTAPRETVEQLRALRATLGRRPGAPRGWSETGGISPALGVKLGLTAGGAAIGAATTPDDPLTGAATGGMIGAATGMAAPKIAEGVSRLVSRLSTNPAEVAEVSQTAGMLGTKEGIETFAKGVWEKLPQVLRFNYLASINLPANAVGGPFASAWFGALERALDGDPRGWAVIREMTPTAFAREFPAGVREAVTKIGRAERHEGLSMAEAGRSTFDRLLAVPGTWMTGGDVTVRRFLERAGFEEPLAREMTMTNEPQWRLVKKLIEFQRGAGPAGQILLPFARTVGNIVERGAERMPGVGFLANRYGRNVPESLKLSAIKQLMGGGAFVAGEQVGEAVDPQSEWARLIRGATSNLGGQSALLSGMGYAAGQARRRGGAAPEMIKAAGTETLGSVPLPKAAPLNELLNVLTTRERPRTIPRGVMPSILKDLLERPEVGVLPSQIHPRSPRHPVRKVRSARKRSD